MAISRKILSAISMIWFVPGWAFAKGAPLRLGLGNAPDVVVGGAPGESA